MSNSPGLVDFATGVVNCVLTLPDRQVKFFGEFTVINPGHQKNIFGQAVKLTFFVPWVTSKGTQHYARDKTVLI